MFNANTEKQDDFKVKCFELRNPAIPISVNCKKINNLELEHNLLTIQICMFCLNLNI